MTDSSSRSSRSPGLPKNSMPKPSCSRSNHAPPMPSTARPSEMWSRVVASLAVRPGFRNVFAPTISPSRTRDVTAPRPARTLQPSKIGCSHGPKMAIRWSHVQTESQPAARRRGPHRGSPANRSAATRAAARSASSAQRHSSSSSWTAAGRNRKRCAADAGTGRDEPLGLVGVIRVVAPGHLGDVGLRGRLVGLARTVPVSPTQR